MPPPPPPSVVILGATSGVAKPIADRFARKGYALVLAGRRMEELETLCTDFRIRHTVPCHPLFFDAMDFEEHAGFPGRCAEVLGEVPDGVVLCFGYMAEQARAQASFDLARAILDTNLTGAVSILERFAETFESRKRGFIAALTSVAGDRGRKSNYLYGASKAGLNVYLQGLRNRLHASHIPVTTVKPGFMDTPMTYGIDLPGPLVVAPEKAAAAIVKAILKKKNEVYVPGFWRMIMFLIRAIPEALFKRMNL